MLAGAITSQIDVTQLVTALFFLFFAGLVFYLRREDKREGYPLEDPGPGKQPLVGFPLPPPPKQYNLLNGGTAEMPHHYSPSEVRAREQFGIAGDALVPTGDPLLDGIDPAAYALRKDEPMYAREGMIQMLPLRELPAWRVAEGDPDPRGMTVIGADGAVAGIVGDIWIDRSVKILRYIEVEVSRQDRPLVAPCCRSTMPTSVGVETKSASARCSRASSPTFRNCASPTGSRRARRTASTPSSRADSSTFASRTRDSSHECRHAHRRAIRTR